ncbi:MAG TPA: type VI secretion system contractile sheath large subunit, partial [Gemmatimonadales bacterium]|nr:type VI secretion system contractile sheath large subunit [Gemmatimonadales bacterium]
FPAAPAQRQSGGEAILAAILDEAVPVTGDEAMARSGGDLQAFIRQVMRPHLVPNPDPRQGELVAQTDAALSATMRAILHHPAFQGVEGLWRALELLVYRLETTSELQVHLLDISAAELAAALPPDGDPQASPFYRILVRHAEEAPWSVLAGAFTFGTAPGDIERLAQLAAIGQLLGAPWLAGAAPDLVGADSLATSPDPRDWKSASDPTWEAFRGTALARSVGLVLPRFLLRLPYGKQYESCERFAFEEFDGDPFHEQFLWGPPGFGVALLLGQAFAERGWGLAQAFEPEIGGLPYVVLGRGAEAEAVPCAETLLTERAASRILDRGIMPLASLKDQDRVRLIRLQSVARPLAPLAGRWPTRG